VTYHSQVAVQNKELHVLNFDTQLSLTVAHNLCGVTSGLNVRNRAPRKGEQPDTMHHGDAVNMIDITRNAAVDPNKEFTCDQCVDFIFDEVKRSMKIRAHYSKFLAQNEAVGAALRLNFGELPQCVALMQMLNVEPGTLFMYEGSLVEVVSVNENNVLVRVDDTFDQFNITLNEAAEFIQSYLG
jgi:hypothetical protein